jgi:zinc transport system substrate-binding protein
MKVHRLLATLLGLALGAGALTSCAGPGDNGKPEVVASFYPLQYVAQRIVGDHAQITNLTTPGAEPHDLELSPRQTASLSSAAVVLYEDGLQPAVDEAIRNDAPQQAVDAADIVKLHNVAGGNGKDPHFWLDPTLLAKVAQAFTTTISKSDTQHAADYRAANEKLQKDLNRLDGQFRAGLSNCRTRTLVASHDAFGYLASRYDLQVQPVAGLSPGAEPSPRHLQELSDLIRTDGITTVFTERLASPKLADTVASDLGIKTAVLDPIEGLTSSDAHDDYLSLMRDNLAAIEKAGGCT